jgi:heme a synthase
VYLRKLRLFGLLLKKKLLCFNLCKTLHFYCLNIRIELTFAAEMLTKTKLQTSRPVAVWLLIGVAMIIVQVILGGITRLTDSGLSITEWKPLLGTVPPLNEKQWNEAFEGYKKIAQYKHLHSYFTLENFKAIFFWEWLHRLWGRIIGVVFLVPFLVFLFQRRFNSQMIKPMIILFLLGALQGAIGWIMVKSGLNDENLYVSHIRLAIHFILALGLLAYTFWFALQLLVPKRQLVADASLRNFTWLLIVLLIVQLVYGAFMAGLKAAAVAPTWPTINGEYFPSNLTAYQGRQLSFFSALVNNPITVHFIHRNIAYILLLLILLYTILSLKRNHNPLYNVARWAPFLLVAMQVGLGILAVLESIKKVPLQWGSFEWMAQLHQVVGMLLLLSLVLQLFLLRKKGHYSL